MKQHEIEDLEKVVTLKYAKENSLWIEDFYSLGDQSLVGGNEHTLVLNFKKKIVYKSNNLINSMYLVTNVLEKVKVHNVLFPETSYSIIGFTGIDSGKNRVPHIEVVLEQVYIPNLSKPEQFEIDLFMENLGFRQTTPQSYVNDKYLVFDLFPRNVLKDKQGNLCVVDAEFRDIEKLKEEENNIREADKNEITLELQKAMIVEKMKNPTYLTEEHKRNSEEVMKYSNSIVSSEVDWIKEVERQKVNAID